MTYLHLVPEIYKNEKQNKHVNTLQLSSTQLQWLVVSTAEKRAMPVSTIGDEDGQEGSPGFKWQVLLQGVGDSILQSQGRENSISGQFEKFQMPFHLAPEHLKFWEPLGNNTWANKSHSQDVHTRWWLMEKSCDTLNFLEVSERGLEVRQNIKEEQTRGICYIPVNVTPLAP